MSTLTAFQKQHGAAYGQLVRSPAFQAALQLLNLRKIERISSLSDLEIETSGKLILADLRGHLSHENDLMSLHVQQETELSDLGPETYPDPEEEIEQAKIQVQPKPRKKK